MYDVLIIGAGVVGAMVARKLSRYSLSVALLEKENDVGNVTSNANSAIVHSGYDPVPGTLKAKLNVEGNKMFDLISEELDVHFKRIGSMTLATSEEQLKTLKELQTRAIANGVETRLLDKEETRKLEPNVSGEVVGALLAPTAGIIDPFNLVVHAVENAVDNGVKLFLEQEVKDIKYLSDHFEVKTDKETGLRTKFYKKETKINKPGFHAKSIEISEKSFTKWDQTDQIKDMTDSDILAEKERKTSSLSLGKSVVGAGAGALAGGLIGGKLGAGGTGALAGAAIGGMAGMDKQTRDKTAIGSGIGAAAGMGLSLLTKGKISNGAKLGAAIGGTAGVISGVASGHAQNKENEFFNDRLNYAKKKAEKRERADWKNNMTNREGYSK